MDSLPSVLFLAMPYDEQEILKTFMTRLCFLLRYIPPVKERIQLQNKCASMGVNRTILSAIDQ